MVDEMDAVAVVDVTAEIVGEHREEYRAGKDRGIREGALRVLNSPSFGQLAIELTLLRNLHESHCDAAEQRERLLAHWKAEAKWWREEHDKVHADYCAFTSMVARKFLK